MMPVEALLGRWRQRLCRPAALPWLMLAGGLVTTGLFCNGERHYRQLEHERIETTLAADITEVVKARLATTTALLDAAVGLFDASEKVTLQEFKTFFRSLSQHGENLNGIQGVGFSALVPANDVAAFERTIRQEGQPDFRIRPAGRRPITSAIIYLEPSDWRNQRAIGFDMYSEASRREAMQEAVDTGEPSLSGPVRLVQETNRQPQSGTLLYLPIYRDPGKPLQSPQERMRRLRGWAYAPMRMGDLINSALASLNNPDKVGTGVLIYDGKTVNPQRLLYDNLGLAGTDRLTHPTWVPVNIANRTWLIGIQLDHRQVSPEGWSTGLLITALLGMSLSSMAAILTRNLVSSHTSLEVALRQEQEAAQERALASTVFDSCPVAIVVTDANGFILRVNQAFTQISGYSAVEARGRKANLLRSGRHDEAFYGELWDSIIQRGHWSGEIWNRHRNGQIRRHELNITAVLDGRNQIVSFVGLLQDVTERYAQQEKMRHLATHDPLTGLANRTLLMEQLLSCLAMARRQGTQVALLFIDLNGFKPVNDRYGHSVGDALLQAVAGRLRAMVRESDTLCRQGGDEFVLLFPNAPDLEQLRAMALKLQMHLAEPYEDLPAGLDVSASFGIARWPDHAEDADGLLDAADNAMYAAKQLGPEHIAIAEPLLRN